MYHVQLQSTQIHKILTDVSWISCTLYSPKETSIFFNDKFSHFGICFKMRNWDSFENTKIYKEMLILWCRCPQTHVRGMDFNLERTHKYFPVYFAGFPLTALVLHWFSIWEELPDTFLFISQAPLVQPLYCRSCTALGGFWAGWVNNYWQNWARIARHSPMLCCHNFAELEKHTELC